MLSLSSRRAWIEIHQRNNKNLLLICRSPHGERGLKSVFIHATAVVPRRSPHGERGLKYQSYLFQIYLNMSLSSRRAWIEIIKNVQADDDIASRSPHGERGLKLSYNHKSNDENCRSPHGERGLKLLLMTEKKRKYIVALLAESVD